MKFEMTGFEFSEFCAQLSKSHAFTRLEELESQLKDARSERDQAWDDKDHWQRRADQFYSENGHLKSTMEAASTEVRSLRHLVEDLRNQLVPNRIERAYSRAFALQLGGQKISAIKEIRALLNIGLKEAKDVVEGGFTDTNHPNLVVLSKIFNDLGKAIPQETQRVRLAPLLSVAFDDTTLDSILAGNFGDSVKAV